MPNKKRSDCPVIYWPEREQKYTQWCRGKVVKFCFTAEEAEVAHQEAHLTLKRNRRSVRHRDAA